MRILALLAVMGVGAGHQPTEVPPKVAPAPRHIAFVHRGGVTPIHLPELTANSQFVWKGEITAASSPQQVTVQDGDTVVEAQVRSLVFRVDRTIKGSAPDSGLASCDLYQSYPSGPLWGQLGGPFEPGWYGIVFLSEEGGRLVPTDLVYPGVRASPGPAPIPETTEPMAAVESELINTLRDPEHERVQSAADLLVLLHEQVSIATRFGPPERVVPLDQRSLITTLDLVAASPDPVLCGTAYAALLRLGDLNRLAEAVAFVEKHGPPPGESTEPSYQGTDNTKYVRGQILHAISRLDDDGAAPLLNPLLQSSDSWVRRNVADALRRIASVSSMPYFAAALDDEDPYVAGSGISGLLLTYQRLRWGDDGWAEYERIGSNVHTVPEWDSGMIPANEDEFQNNPEPYRAWWKDWWETTGKVACDAATGASDTGEAR